MRVQKPRGFDHQEMRSGDQLLIRPFSVPHLF
jgi:hypothetical protein